MYDPVNALRGYEVQERELGGREQDRAMRNQLAQLQFASQERARAQQNMLAQAQMQQQARMGGDRNRIAQERVASQERLGQARMNQPIWDADRGVFVQRPGMGGMGGGVITPPGLPPRRNPEMEKMQAKAAFQLPETLQQAQMAIQQIDQMIGNPEKGVKEHAGFQNAVGMPNVITGLAARMVPGMFPGSDTASFNKRLDQIKGGAFLQAFESLKGGGQITEVEGKKATEAITRLDTAQSEKEFVAAARELQGIIMKGMENARRQAATAGDRPAQPGGMGGFKVLGVEGK